MKDEGGKQEDAETGRHGDAEMGDPGNPAVRVSVSPRLRVPVSPRLPVSPVSPSPCLLVFILGSGLDTGSIIGAFYRTYLTFQL